VSSTDLKGSTTSSQGIRGNISVMPALKFNVLLEIIEELVYLAICWFIWRSVGIFDDLLVNLATCWIIWRPVGLFGDLLVSYDRWNRINFLHVRTKLFYLYSFLN
jgi:hypothetical protein